MEDIEFKEHGEEYDITISNLVRGQYCEYRLRANCGAPGFSALGSDKFDIEYVAFDRQEILDTVRDSSSGEDTNFLESSQNDFSDQNKRG